MRSLDDADSEYKLLVEVNYKGAEFIGNKVHSLTHSITQSHTQLYIFVQMKYIHI